MVEIGILRYPDKNLPYFKLYRLKLTAFSDSSRILFIQEDRNGIIGELNVRRFKPNAAVLAKLSSKATETAATEAESLIFG